MAHEGQEVVADPVWPALALCGAILLAAAIFVFVVQLFGTQNPYNPTQLRHVSSATGYRIWYKPSDILALLDGESELVKERARDSERIDAIAQAALFYTDSETATQHVSEALMECGVPATQAARLAVEVIAVMQSVESELIARYSPSKSRAAASYDCVAVYNWAQRKWDEADAVGRPISEFDGSMNLLISREFGVSPSQASIMYDIGALEAYGLPVPSDLRARLRSFEGP